MKPKKKPNHDLNRYSGIFFSFGLALTLFLSWQAIEWKNYRKKVFDYERLKVEQQEEEEIPITDHLKPPPPPPPPPPAPEIIHVVDNEVEIIETVILSTETNQDEIIFVDVEHVDVIEEFIDEDIPFAIIEDVPIFPGCEDVPKSQRRDCFQEKIDQHIRRTFEYPKVAQHLGIQGKVYVSFVIAKDGFIVNIRSRGPDKSLTQEAERIIIALPQMIPGKQRGKPVRVPFSVPITFRLQQTP